MGMAYLVGLCASFFLASSVNAAVTLDLGPTDYRVWGSGTSQHTLNGLRHSVGTAVRMPNTGASLPVVRNPVIPYSGIGSVLRTVGRGTPAAVLTSAAMSGIFYAMDWFFDQETQQWMKDGYEVVPPVPGTGWRINSGTAACAYTNTGISYASPDAACEFAGPCQSTPRSEYSVTLLTSNTARCTLTNPGSITINVSGSSIMCPIGSNFRPETGTCAKAAPVPLEDSDWSSLDGALPNFPAGQVGGAAGDGMDLTGGPAPGYSDDPITGPSSVTGTSSNTTSTNANGDTIVTNTNITNNYTYGPTTISETTITTTTTYQNGTQTGTETTVETPSSEQVVTPTPTPTPTATEWPLFCSWASIVCEWIGWTKEPLDGEEPDLSSIINDDDYERSKTVSFGSKECPPDYELHLSFPKEFTATVSMQWFCDLAAIIYFMVMASAYVYAAYISVGVVRV